ncbi:T9SS type A sorting domain-containing protein [Flavivirga aquimarina]|uniref:T9SS type A sorting domain-containing protein n=1 Tax=Flavivirga aquimarina TaxID=2027862 RepID=A0ABT8WFZ7_9FLAO|nr:T9SS type A sorting domain-containing protein [Flavivirga aquimarina]MDO5972075.1 T9SS type A sorting domain-containing protein [Flavivirga aquimarina]
MKKKLRNVLLTTLALSTGIAFSQTIVFDFDNGTVATSGASVTQTISINDNGNVSEYILTASHSPDTSGQAFLYSYNGDQMFYYGNPPSGGGEWNISLTKDGASQTFTLNEIDFVDFNPTGQTLQFSISGDTSGNSVEIMEATDIVPPSASSGTTVSFTDTDFNNNTNLSSFTISTPNDSGTQYIDFHNISITIPEATLSVEEKSSDNFKVTATPNPTTDKVTIKFNNAIATENEFNILDVNGRLIKSQKSSKLQETIDLSSFKSGVYFVKISNGKYIKTLRLIKE